MLCLSLFSVCSFSSSYTYWARLLRCLSVRVFAMKHAHLKLAQHSFMGLRRNPYMLVVRFSDHDAVWRYVFHVDNTIATWMCSVHPCQLFKQNPCENVVKKSEILTLFNVFKHFEIEHYSHYYRTSNWIVQQKEMCQHICA